MDFNLPTVVVWEWLNKKTIKSDTNFLPWVQSKAREVWPSKSACLYGFNWNSGAVYFALWLLKCIQDHPELKWVMLAAKYCRLMKLKKKSFLFWIRNVDLKYDVAMDDAQLYWNSGWCINLTVQWLTLFYCIALNFASTVDGALF